MKIRTNHVMFLRKSIPSRGGSYCLSPEAGIGLVCLSIEKKAGDRAGRR